MPSVLQGIQISDISKLDCSSANASQIDYDTFFIPFTPYSYEFNQIFRVLSVKSES